MKHQGNKNNRTLTVLSANVRGLLTNIGDLTHTFVNPNNVDIVATVETFFNDTVPTNYGRISGYTNWYRRDRVGRDKGGIAVCFKTNLRVQLLDVSIPEHMEILFFKIWLNNSDTMLFCTCYRPQWQGSQPIEFLQRNLDELMVRHSCEHLLIVGDMNQNLVIRPFEDLLAVFGLMNHVDFPTHMSGSSLDPVITDLPETLISCKPLGYVGSSDHQAVHTTISVCPTYDRAFTRTTWLWNQADWKGFREALQWVNWEEVLQGDVSEQAEAFTNVILEKMYQFVPHRTYKVKPCDQPWFGYQCRKAADEKSKAWNRYKRFPTTGNKEIHERTCRKMKETQSWAIKKWQDDLKRKLTGRSVGSRSWWQLIKQQQGFMDDDTIPPLSGLNGLVAISSEDKANLLASHFAEKMSVSDPDRIPSAIPYKTNYRISTCSTNKHQVEKLLRSIDVKKALGPDNISPHVLKKCAVQLSEPLARLFNTCSEMQAWPKIWKRARVVASHKKKSRTSVENYRPISLLSIIGKIYERILVTILTDHLEKHHLLSLNQFGFRKERSSSDLLLQMTASWNRSLDKGEDVYVIALDIAGAFDKVWHAGLIEKIKSFGIEGNLLSLIKDYLQDRVLQVVVNGHTSKEHKIKASVPQGSVLGPLFWNIYFNDILHLVPEAQAYADDCTLSFSCNKDNHHQTILHINETLKTITSWGKKWQVMLASEKTQLMLVSRRSRPTNVPNIKLNGDEIIPEPNINILGIQFDETLSFAEHVKELASRAAKKFACLRRVVHILDDRGCQMLYNSQIRSLMEYSPLVWISCPPSYLRLLDKIQERVLRLVNSKRLAAEPTAFQSLQHRRAVSGLCVVYKVQVKRYPHIAGLRLPPAPSATYHTRQAPRTGFEVEVPFARTSQCLRSFHCYFARLWNHIVQRIDVRVFNSLQNFKCRVHAYLLENSELLNVFYFR